MTGNVLKRLQVRLEEKGKDHVTLTLGDICHQVDGTTSWGLANGEQALKALLLKS